MRLDGTHSTDGVALCIVRRRRRRKTTFVDGDGWDGYMCDVRIVIMNTPSLSLPRRRLNVFHATTYKKKLKKFRKNSFVY